MKTCSKCKVEQPTSGFHRHRNTKDGFHYTCKSCRSAYAKKKVRDKMWREKTYTRNTQYRRDEPEIRRFTARKSWLKVKYGITIEEYDTLLEKQGGGCALCHRHDSGVTGSSILRVDHCHETGEVRGLLCHKCNLCLGCVEDKIDLLYSAIEYLKRGLT